MQGREQEERDVKIGATDDGQKDRISVFTTLKDRKRTRERERERERENLKTV